MGEGQNKEILKKVISFKKKIKNKYSIERMILFGSAARTNCRDFNGIDLIIVTRKKHKRLQFLPKLYHEWHIKQKINFPVDFISFDSEAFEKLIGEVSIASQALKEGIEI